MVAALDAVVDLYLGSVIGGDRALAQMGDAVFDDRDLHAVLIENDRGAGKARFRAGMKGWVQTHREFEKAFGEKRTAAMRALLHAVAAPSSACRTER